MAASGAYAMLAPVRKDRNRAATIRLLVAQYASAVAESFESPTGRLLPCASGPQTVIRPKRPKATAGNGEPGG